MISEILQLVVACIGITFGFSFACRFDDYEDFDKMTPAMQKVWQPKGKMIFWFVRYYLAPRLSDYWQKPFYQCVICMASVQSIIPCLWMFGVDAWMYWPFVALITAGINGLISFNFNTN